jgi:hypothetical protein
LNFGQTCNDTDDDDDEEEDVRALIVLAVMVVEESSRRSRLAIRTGRRVVEVGYHVGWNSENGKGRQYDTDYDVSDLDDVVVVVC